MIGRILHRVRVWRARRREASKEARSPHWSSIRDAFLRSHPRCEACWGEQELQVHHVTPFSVNAKLELETTNLITLCMGPKECHLKIGHGGSFEYYNPTVRHDAEFARFTPDQFDAVCVRAKASRKRE